MDPTTPAPVPAAPAGHDHGLRHDLARLGAGAALPVAPPSALGRRRALGLLGGGALVAALAACDPGPGTVTGGGCAPLPGEMAGPYPADHDLGPDVLVRQGIVRRDLRRSLAPATGVAAGVPLTVRLIVRDVSEGCADVAGAAVYLWHCTREGGYSLYTDGLTGESFLRGVQPTDAHGVATFTTVFPGCYPGRWPHLHLEVYRDVAAATGSGDPLLTSQIALPEAACHDVYSTSGYAGSHAAFMDVDLGSDISFSDGTTHQVADVADGPDGRVATVALGIA